MSEFKSLEGKSLSAVTMRKGGQKRVRLHGAGADRSALSLNSSKFTVVNAKLTALFDGPKGIWTVDLNAAQLGSATITAAIKKQNVASLSVSVVAPLELPDPDTDYGMMVRLFMVESRKPSESGYNKADSELGMKWMRLVLQNRLKSSEKYAAPGARNLCDIVRASGQFGGFENYPALASKQKSAIDAVLKIANDDSDPRQQDLLDFIQNAMNAASGSPITDPSAKGLVAWRTAGSGSPGPRFAAHGKPLAGNQFYTLK